MKRSFLFVRKYRGLHKIIYFSDLQLTTVILQFV